MDRQVKVNVQRFEPIGNGRVKVKIAEKNFNISNLVHEGVPYVAIKKYGRGRYMMKLQPGYVQPAPAPPEPITFDEFKKGAMDLKIDTSPEPIPVDLGRVPMVYNTEVLS